MNHKIYYFFIGFFLLFMQIKPAQVVASCKIQGKPWLEGRIKTIQKTQKTQQTSKFVDARIGQEIEVFLVVKGLMNKRSVIFSDDGQKGRVPFAKSGCGNISVSWRKVEPYMGHVRLKSPNPNMSVYANAVVFGPKHGKWIGFDQIEYFETSLSLTEELEDSVPSSTSLVVKDARPYSFAAPRSKEHERLGTMRLAATMTIGDQKFSTKGAEDAPEGMISDSVFRYSFRSGDGFLGWLTSYFNVPYLFGSVDWQVERRLGADCADVFVAALHDAGKKNVAYTNVGGLIDLLGKISGPAVVKTCSQQSLSDCDRVSKPSLRFGKEVQPGDILAINYSDTNIIPRTWAHIVVLVEDRGPHGKPDGILGPHDIVADSGSQDALKFAPLGYQGNITVLIARPKQVSIF